MMRIGSIVFIAICVIFLRIGSLRTYDGSGLLGTIHHAGSGTLVSGYQVLSESSPWTINDNIIDEYTQKGNGIVHSYQLLFADWFWIRNIQQVGTYILKDETPGLMPMMKNLFSLSPKWLYPYIFIQYIGPKPEQENTITDTISFGEKGLKMTCDMDRVEKIINLSDQDFVQIIESRSAAYHDLKDPCSSYELPQLLGFNHYEYNKNIDRAIALYKVASFHNNAPLAVPTMPALLRSKQGEHLIGAQLWLSRANLLSQRLHEPGIMGKYNKAIKKSVFEAIVHIIEKTSTEHPECNQSYTCLVQGGHIQNQVENINDSCVTTKGVLCLLTQEGKKNGYITTSQDIFNPLSDNFDNKRVHDEERGRRTE